MQGDEGLLKEGDLLVIIQCLQVGPGRASLAIILLLALRRLMMILE